MIDTSISKSNTGLILNMYPYHNGISYEVCNSFLRQLNFGVQKSSMPAFCAANSPNSVCNLEALAQNYNPYLLRGKVPQFFLQLDALLAQNFNPYLLCGKFPRFCLQPRLSSSKLQYLPFVWQIPPILSANYTLLLYS